MMNRRARGRTEHLAGLAAEERIAQDYERRGFPVAGRRWRGQGGEIDLIARDGDALIFIEVKKSVISTGRPNGWAPARWRGCASRPRNSWPASRADC